MDKNRFLSVSLLVISTLTCAVVTAEEKVASKENKAKPGMGEFEKALALTPNIDNGRKLYKMCVTCHGPEGWGDDNGA